MSTRTTQAKLSRRNFLKISAITGACLVLGFDLEGRQVLASDDPGVINDRRQATGFEPAIFVRIDPDGTVTIYVPRSELGQGVNTALPMVLADELEADFAKVHVEQTLASSRYGSQATGGSTSIQDFYSVMRRAGAIGRTMLITAAAQTWSVNAAECYAELGTVIHKPSGKKLTYGELVAAASQVAQPKFNEIKMKDKKDFRYIGKPHGQIDNPHFVDGSARFTSDMQLPDMLIAVVARCPTFGGSVASFDDTKAKAVPGVTHVVKIATGVAVVASNTWAALQGRAALQITWDHGKNANLSSDDLRQKGLDIVKKAAANTKEDDSGVDHYIEAIYESPYLAHAPMEPMTCVADVTADKCEVWAPTQDRQSALYRAQSISRVKSDAVMVHVPTVGGAFGRRLNVDYVEEAVEISKTVGKPIKLFWSREDDLQHDFYRTASYHLLRAGVDKAGLPVIWRHYVAAQDKGEMTAGASSLPYSFRVMATPGYLPSGIPVGYWRSVFNPPNAFANECFIDELAIASGKDPFEFRMQLVSDKRMKPVLQMAGEKAGWGTTLPKGWARGVACHSTWGVSEVAQVVELSVDENGNVKVSRVVCVIDCGVAVNPDMIAAQMEGGIVFGLIATLKDEVTFKNGQAQLSSLQDYRLLRFDEMPKIEVHIIPSDRAPQGTGEMGNPPTAPAIANAIFAATGKRIRRLPIRPEDLKQS